MWPLCAQDPVADDTSPSHSQQGAPLPSGDRWLCTGDEAVSALSFPAAGFHLLVLPNLACDEKVQGETGLWGSHALLHLSLFPGVPAPNSASIMAQEVAISICRSYARADDSAHLHGSTQCTSRTPHGMTGRLRTVDSALGPASPGGS